jgi:hypothetical protein
MQVKIDIDELEKALALLRRVNQAQRDTIEWTRGGEKVPLDVSRRPLTLEEWETMGLNNVDYYIVMVTPQLAGPEQREPTELGAMNAAEHA